MATVKLVTLLVPVVIEFMVGMALNIHILLIYIGNLQNGQSLGPSDKVHLIKALTSISLHVMMTAECLICVFWPYLFTSAFLWNPMIDTFLVYYSYWLTAVLCVYYCTSVSNSGHHFFVWLKRSLSSYLLHILLASGLGSLAISIPVFWFCSLEPAGNATSQTIFQGVFLITATYRTVSSILGCLLPFTIALVSIAFTSWSLINHIWKMKQNNPRFPRSTFQTQINATRTMILFLLTSVIYNVVQMVITNIALNTSSDLLILAWFVDVSYPTSEAVIIIQSSSKLRNTFLEKFFNRKRKNIEAET